MAGLFHLGSRMADLDITGRVVVDASQAEGAFDRVADKAEQMGREVANAARQAGKEVDGMGDGANTSAEKFTRAEARIRDSIKRSTQELNLLGKTASEKLEFKIADKGLDSSKFTSYIAELKKAEAAQMALGAASVRSGSVASASLDSMGMSANATAAALRGVPAQFTDIITSLQGGQAPLTVFLQQGGQLKDMFGGAGNAARALGGYVVGLINPFTLAAGAVAALGLAYFQGSKEADAYNKAIITTGNAAGTTASQMQQMAQRISSVVGTQGAAAATLAQLAGSSRIAAENFEYFGTVALKVEKTVGTAVAETVKQFAELGKAPVEASKKLNEETNYLTQAIYEQIKALKDQGREAEAAATAQKAYADAINSRSDQMTQNLGLIERAWRGITGAAKVAWDAMLNVGRQDTLQDQIGAIRTRLDAARSERGMTGAFGQTGIDKGIEVLQQRLSLLTEQERLLKRGAESQAARAQAEKAAIEATDALGKANEKALTKQEQMNKALGEYRANLEKVKAVNPNSALLDPAQVEKSEKAIRAQFTERTVAVRKGNDELQKQQDLIAKLSGLDPSFSREWEQLSKAYAAGKINLSQLVDLQAQLLAKQPAITAATKAQAEAEKERAKTAEALVKTMEAYAKANQEGVAQSIQAATQAEAQLAQYGLLKSEVQGLTLEYLEQSRASAALAGEDVSNIDKRIAAQKQLIAATRGLEAREIADTAAKTAAAEWKRTAESIEQSLTDSLLRGFESGKDFAKNLRDTVINMFKTLVLRPTISALMSPIAGALTGGLGLSGAAQAATGGSSLLGNIGSIASGANSLGLLGSIGATVSGAVGSAIGAVSGGLVAANAATATLITGSAASAAAAAAGAATAGGAAAGAAASAAAAGSSIAAAVGVLGPLALGVGALMAIAKATKGETRTGGQFGVAFDGSVTNQRRDQTYTMAGQQFDRDFTNGLATAVTNGLAYRLEGDPVGQESAIKKAIEGTATGINALLKSLGSAAVLTGFSAGLETSGKGRGGVFSGGLLSTGQSFGESGKGDNYAGTLYEKFSTDSPDFKQALTDFTLDLKQATIQALQSVSDIPKTVQDLLKGVDAEALADDAADALLIAINTQIVGVQQLQAAFNAMGMSDLAALGFDAAAGLAKAAGGFDQLGNGLASYYENFYSESEKAANVTRQVTEALAAVGLEMPKTRDEFRAMVESQVAMGEEGQAAYVTLLNVSGAFASVTTTAETATIAVSKVNQDLMDQLSVLTGAETARSLALRDATDPATKALLEQIYVQQDLKAATEAAATAAAALASTNLGIQDQIDLLTGKETERSLALRDATDSTTKVLLEQLYVQQDLKAAADLAPVIDTTAQALNNLGNVLSRFGDTLNLRSDILRRGAATQGATPSLSFAETRGTNDVDAYDTKTLSEWLADDAARINGYVKDQADAISSAAAKWTGDLFKLATENYDNNAEATVGPAFAASFKKRSAQFDSFFTDLGKFASQLEINLSNSADSAIGATLQLGSIADYFADLATEITTIEKLLAGTAAKAGATFNANEFAGDIAGGAAAVSAAITASILSKVPDAVKNDPALAGVSTNILSLLGSVGKDDVQGINDSFLLLSGALTRGELTSTQYTAAIDYVTGAFTNGVAEAAKTEASLQSVIDQLAQVNREIARVGFTPFENALAEIQDRADEAAKAFGSFAPEITALAEAERTLLNKRNEIAANATLGGLAKETSRLDMTPLELQMLGIADRADDYKQSLIDLGQATVVNIAAVDAWAAATTGAAVAANAATAQMTVDGLQREIDRVNFTPLQKELAGITDRQTEYIGSLASIGQATTGNVAVVNQWAETMTAAAIAAAQVQTATGASLDGVIESLANVNSEIARVGLSSFETAIAEIQDRADAAAKTFGSLAPEITALANAERALIGARNQAAAAATISQVQQEIDRINFTPLQRELAEISDRGADYISGLQDIGQATAENIGIIDQLMGGLREQVMKREAEAAAAEARAAAERQAADALAAQQKIAADRKTAADMIDGLAREVARSGMSQLQLQFAGINDSAADYVKSLQEIGQATAANIAAVDAWSAAMTGAVIATNKATAKATIDDLQKQIDRINFTPLQKELAGIDDQRTAYIASLTDIGQATAGNIDVVDAWANAMRDASIKADGAADFARRSDIAFGALERAAQAQRKALGTQLSAAQDLASEVRSVFDTLKTSVNDLYRSVDSTAQQSAAQARAFIANALSGALATGALPESKALNDAIAAARGGMDGAQYATQFEGDRDRLVLAGQLGALQDLAGVQLTEAERQIKALDAQLEALDQTLQTARDQLDVMRGIDISVTSVGSAVQALTAAIAAERSALIAAQGPAPVAGVPSGSVNTAYSPITTTTGSGNAEMVAELRELRTEVVRLRSEVANGNVSTKQLAEQFDQVSASGNALAVEVMV